MRGSSPVCVYTTAVFDNRWEMTCSALVKTTETSVNILMASHPLAAGLAAGSATLMSPGGSTAYVFVVVIGGIGRANITL